jgi:regulator of sigma E protease
MLTGIFSVIIFLLVLSFLVIIHELGHFITAKFFKVRVEEFGIGYPPRALKLFQKWNTEFTLNWVPFGGFVKMEGEELGVETAGIPPVTEQKAKTSTQATLTPKQLRQQVGPFYQKSVFARLVIILAGATINFVFGVIAFAIFFSITGIPSLAPNVRISEVSAGSPAAAAGLTANVDVKQVEKDGQLIPVTSTDQVVEVVTAQAGKTIAIVTTGTCEETTCKDETHLYKVKVRRAEEIPAGQGPTGVRFEPVVAFKFYPWYEMPIRGSWYGLQQAFGLTLLILQTLGDIGKGLLHAQLPTQVAGPVGIVSEATKRRLLVQGPLQVLNFAGMLSINLAIMNVLPIPALDGGRALFILLEILLGKKRVQTFESKANYIGFALLIILIVLITARDIRKLFI